MRYHIFIANTYSEAKSMLEDCVGNFYVKDLISVKSHPLEYTFSGDNKYRCTSINSIVSLRGIKWETIYVHENISHKFMREVLPSLHYRFIYYYHNFKDIRNV